MRAQAVRRVVDGDELDAQPRDARERRRSPAWSCATRWRCHRLDARRGAHVAGHTEQHDVRRSGSRQNRRYAPRLRLHHAGRPETRRS